MGSGRGGTRRRDSTGSGSGSGVGAECGSDNRGRQVSKNITLDRTATAVYTVKTMGTSLYRVGRSLLSVRLTFVIYPSTMSPNSGNVWQSCAATSPATKYDLSPHALTPFSTSMYMPAKYTCDTEERQCVCACVCVSVCACVSVHGAVNVHGGAEVQRNGRVDISGYSQRIAFCNNQ